MNDVIRPKRLTLKNMPSHGCEIYADVEFEADCVEYTLKEGWQPIAHMCTDVHRRQVGHWEDQMVAHELWIQFPPDEYTAMKDQLFAEMVDAWNEKYATVDET